MISQEEIQKGMYLRLSSGKIWKDDGNTLYFSDILKAGYDIVDVIEPKDIILGKDGKIYQCWKVDMGYVFTYSKDESGQTIILVDYQIDRILGMEKFMIESRIVNEDENI